MSLPAQSKPTRAVLWHYAKSDSWHTVWLGDDANQAEREALLPRPAMEPGEAIIVLLMTDREIDAIHSEGFRQGFGGGA